jgi:para-aminobenzoate synthetase/4-amino-4-deoxychorismate lyase
VPGPAGDNSLPAVDFFVSPRDTKTPWCFHKTTMRSLYDRAYEKARASGLYDYIFFNEEGEVTEGSITNIVIYSGGRYRTPPVASGLLPGVMRKKLLADMAVPVVEQVLTEQDVRAAEAVFLCNSVRGVIRVRVR